LGHYILQQQHRAAFTLDIPGSRGLGFLAGPPTVSGSGEAALFNLRQDNLRQTQCFRPQMGPAFGMIRLRWRGGSQIDFHRAIAVSETGSAICNLLGQYRRRASKRPHQNGFKCRVYVYQRDRVVRIHVLPEKKVPRMLQGRIPHYLYLHNIIISKFRLLFGHDSILGCDKSPILLKARRTKGAWHTRSRC